MVQYICPRCGYETDRKSSIQDHINKKKICKPILSNIIPKDNESWILKGDKKTPKKLNDLDEINNKIKELEEKVKTLTMEVENLKEKQDCGHLYVMYNDSFQFHGKNVYKVGCSKNPQNRIKNFTTSYPTPSKFEYISKEINNKLKAEKHLFSLIDNSRLQNNREFFKIDLDVLIKEIKKVEEIFS